MTNYSQMQEAPPEDKESLLLDSIKLLDSERDLREVYAKEHCDKIIRIAKALFKRISRELYQ